MDAKWGPGHRIPPQEGAFSGGETRDSGDLRGLPGVILRDREGAGPEKDGGYPTSMCPGTFLMRRSRTSFPMICSGVN